MRHPFLPAVLAALAAAGPACEWQGRPTPAGTLPQVEAVASPAATDTAAVADSAATATAPQGTPQDAGIDSMRAAIARLDETVAALARSHDALLTLLGTGAPSARPAGPTGGQDLLEGAGAQVRNYGMRSFWAIVVLALTTLTVRIGVAALNTLSERSATRRLFFKRLVPITRIVLWSIAVYFTIRVVFDVDAQGLLAAAAALGVAVGFAAQDILKNIFGGLVIVFDQPFQVGDKIKVGDNYGEVVSIGLRSTRIVTPDDSTVTVPNAQVVDSQVSNANSGALDCQVVADLYLPGWVDEAKAREIALQAAASSKYVYLGKPIVVLVRDEFRETFITHLKVKAYVVDARHEFAFMSDITERARAEFRRAGLLKPLHGARAWFDLSGGGLAESDGRAAHGSESP